MAFRLALLPLFALRSASAPWGVAQDRTAPLCSLQGLLGALRDCLAFVLSDQGHYAHYHVVGIGHVSSDEVDPRVTQGEQEGSVTGQTVQLRDYQCGPCDLG